MSDFNVGFVIFPDITQLDFTGPFEVLSRLATPPSISAPSAFAHSRTHIVAKSMQPVLSARGLGILPTCVFESCPQLDLICVPGGAGVVAAIADNQTVDFVRSQSARAHYVTSVCTGAFLLGAAGLLKGRRAATHWAYLDLMPLVGATHEKNGSCATATSLPRAASPLELTSRFPLSPSSRDRKSRRLFSLRLSTTRRRHSMAAIPTRPQRQPSRLWSNATRPPAKACRSNSRSGRLSVRGRRGLRKRLTQSTRGRHPPEGSRFL